jgi:hypothetical protein
MLTTCSDLIQKWCSGTVNPAVFHEPAEEVYRRDPTKTEGDGGNPIITKTAELRLDPISKSSLPGWLQSSSDSVRYILKVPAGEVYKERINLTTMTTTPTATVKMEDATTHQVLKRVYVPIETDMTRSELPLETPLEHLPHHRIPIPRPFPVVF